MVTVRRLGILGGTFDPVHFGHLVAAVSARDQLLLERVLLIPNTRSPLKTAAPVAPVADRLAMLRLAVAGTDGLVVSDLESARGGVSYTVDTLRAVRAAYADAELFLILGSDALADFGLWRDHDDVRELARLVGIDRGDGEVAASVPDARIVRMPRLDISSSDIRARIAAGRSIDFLTPSKVVAYIMERRLYRSS